MILLILPAEDKPAAKTQNSEAPQGLAKGNVSQPPLGSELSLGALTSPLSLLLLPRPATAKDHSNPEKTAQPYSLQAQLPLPTGALLASGTIISPYFQWFLAYLQMSLGLNLMIPQILWEGADCSRYMIQRTRPS